MSTTPKERQNMLRYIVINAAGAVVLNTTSLGTAREAAAEHRPAVIRPVYRVRDTDPLLSPTLGI